MNFKENLQEQYKISLSKEQLEKFEIYYQNLVEYNKHTNLTTITEKKDVYYKHFFDSLTIIEYLKDGIEICDMGSGAGFPSIPLKIVYPNLKVTIIDSANKRIKFLSELVNHLKLTDVNLVHSRIEEFGLKNQEKFDVVTARALGNLRMISEMAIPMLKNEGLFIAMKGQNFSLELVEAKNAIKVLKSRIIEEKQFELPYEYGNRSIIIIKKEKHISGYPREYQQMLKKPL